MGIGQRPRGAHFATPDRPASGASFTPSQPGRPDETSVFLAAAARQLRASSPSDGSSARIAADTPPVREHEVTGNAEQRAEKSSNMVSVLIIISRITGFFRTSAQAWALGAVGLASTYTVAINMPNMLYELVMGGMLITSFLPVYLSVKRNLGKDGAADYASNLLSLVLILMAAVTAVSFLCAGPIIWTQSAGASEGFDFDLSVWFFRWFVCEIILYALSSIVSGVLNAERDYFWSNAAPILNNLITISSFLIYGYLVEQHGVAWHDAVIVLAIGNPLGVAVQVFSQIPALRRHGVRLRLRINLHDPALRDTLSIGLPTLVVTFASFPTTAVMSSCALSVTPAGASISYYARVWYVLPYSVFAIPISVTMFTELSSCHVKGDMRSFVGCVTAGMRKLFFTLIPFAMYLIVFAPCLIAIFTTGKFTADAAAQTSGYLQALALALPFYGLSSYLQKVCSSMLRMRFYALSTCIAAVVQIAICLALTPSFGLYVVPVSSAFFYGAIDVVTLVRIRSELGSLGMRGVLASSMRALVLGGAGALAGWLILQGLALAIGPASGVLRGVLYAAVAGIPAVIITFGTASALGISDAPFFDAIFGRLFHRKAKA